MAKVSATKIRAAVASVLAGLMLAGCAGDGLPTIAGGGGTASIGNGAPADSAISSQPKAAAFNPFNDLPADRPLREVIQNPSLAEVMKPGPLPEFSIGREDAPVTIIKYASMTCPYCRKFQAEVFPTLKRDYIDRGKVRFIIREFPIGKTSGMATIAMRCAPMSSYLTLYERYMQQQAQWVSQEVRLDPIFKVAQGVGMTREQFDSCRQNQAMIDGLKWIKDRGRELGVIGTPNFFINGKLVKKALNLAELRGMIDPLLSGAVASREASTTR